MKKYVVPIIFFALNFITYAFLHYIRLIFLCPPLAGMAGFISTVPAFLSLDKNPAEFEFCRIRIQHWLRNCFSVFLFLVFSLELRNDVIRDD